MKELNDHELLQQLTKQLEEQRKLLDQLAARIAHMESKLRNPFSPQPYQMNVNDSCPKCGLRLDQGPMGYVCSVPKCPTGLGGSWC